MKQAIMIFAMILGTSIYTNAQGKGKDRGGKPEKFENKSNFNKGGGPTKGKDKAVISIEIKQEGKGKEKGNPHHFNGKGNSDQVFNGHPSGKNKHHKEVHKHHGNGNAYGHHKGGMSGREFGQARAAAARNKHKHYTIVTIGDGRRYLTITRKRNILLLSITRTKLIDLRLKLNELHVAGSITTVAYKEKIKKVEILEQQRASIEVKIKV